MPDSTHQKEFAPSGFFALRTPLLPFDELTAWSEGLESPSALTDAARLEQAMAADRARLRWRLREIVARSEVRDALFVASPDLDESLEVWMREPDGERGQRIERALVRYFARMAGRATLFGLFAGSSVGVISDETRLVIEERTTYRRHTRLDMDYLFALTEDLRRDSSLRKVFTYRPNSSLYRAAGRVRYVEARLDGKARSYHLVAVEDSDYLAATLARAENGAAFESLAAALVDDEVTLADAEEYVNELIDSQILVPDIALPVTGPEAIHPLVEQLSQHAETKSVADLLRQVQADLAAMDAEGLGVAPERYRAVARRLESLPTKVELSRLFQVDMVKPAPQAVLGKAVLDEIARGVEVLHRMARRGEDALQQFRDAFIARYEQREVPLLEALDEEVGVGFGSSEETSPLLEGLHFPPASDTTTTWDARQNIQLRKLSEALQRGEREIALEPRDLETLAPQEPPPLPAAFEVMATVAADSETALRQGDFQVILGGVYGPSGARLLGRFCHADETLHRLVEQHLRAEESLHPRAVFAEIVHLPEGRIGNVLARPVLRDYEIPYLGYSSAPVERQIPATDLRVSVQGERIVLRSQRLGREVIPRMTNAHNYNWGSLGVYRFLCMLQTQGVIGGLMWDWDALQSAPFLPRVTTGRLVLSLARWRMSKDEIKRLSEQRGAALFQAVQAWRAERRLPRWVALADADNVLPVDLDNVLSVETLVHLIKGRTGATLTEMFPAPDQLCASGTEGRFVHELVVPFVRVNGARGQPGNRATTSLTHLPIDSLTHLSRSFPPGSEWLYAKFYTGTATADGVLRDVVAPLVRKVLDVGAADRWFFIRYGDPDWHLRLRFHGDPEKLHADVLPALHAAVNPLLEDGRLWRAQLDTYEREVERYGGADGIALAEQIFHVDSEAVLKMVELLEPGDEGLDERWRLALRGIDALLNDFGFDLNTKLAMMKQARESFGKEFRADKNLESQLSDKFRKERKNLESLLRPDHDEDDPLSPGFEILQRRSEQFAPIIAELKACEQAGKLLVPLTDLALSYVHMHVNRLLRSAQRQQELVLYDFLVRLYKSQVAQARSGR